MKNKNIPLAAKFAKHTMSRNCEGCIRFIRRSFLARRNLGGVVSEGGRSNPNILTGLLRRPDNALASSQFLPFLIVLLLFIGRPVFAQINSAAPAATSTSAFLAMPPSDDQLKTMDSDRDGLSDYDEIYIYHTDPYNPDTDGDGYTDGDEVKNGFDPNKAGGDPFGSAHPSTVVQGDLEQSRTGQGRPEQGRGGDKLQKEIDIDLKTQTLTYSLGPYQLAKILVSTGVKSLPTPPGDYTILKKVPVVRYKGTNYNYPNTRWNMMFKQQSAGNLYIHGAYWHHNFGHVMSHGCVNVSYADMEPLYDWADVGTKVHIQ